MWEPRRLRSLCISTVCYRDSFTFFYYMSLCVFVSLFVYLFICCFLCLITCKFIRLSVSLRYIRHRMNCSFWTPPRQTVAACLASVYICSTDNSNEVYKTSSVSEIVNNATFMQTLDSSISMTGYIIMPLIGTHISPPYPVSDTHAHHNLNTALRVHD
jgi:hypothetical protein